MAYRSAQVDVLEGSARFGLDQSGLQYSPRDETAMSNWIVPPEQVCVDDETPLGGGSGSRTTFKGTWNGTVVAIKRLPQDSSRQVILDHVQRYRSPTCSNVLQVLGASSEVADPPYILSPFFMNGCITEYLGRYPGASRPKAVAEVALGMEYLHSMNIDHGRLKTSNILVTDNGHACVADPGLYGLPNMPPSSHLFLSPETWKGVVSQASDVFSFAMVAYEILTSVPPWGYLSENQVFKLVVKLEERPERKPSHAALPLTDKEWQTLEHAWHTNPDARPTFKQIVARLNARALGNVGPELSRSLLLASERATPAPDTHHNSPSFHNRPLSILQAELDANTRPLNIQPPPAPPAYVPSDDITTFRPSASGPTEKGGLRSFPEVAPSRTSQHSSPGNWNGYASNQQQDSRSYPSTAYNGQNYQQQQYRPPSADSSSSSGFYGSQVYGRPPLPPESPLTDRSSPVSAYPGSQRRDTTSSHRSMDYLARQYSAYESPGFLAAALPSSPMLHHQGLDLTRAPTASSTASSITPSSHKHWRPPTAESIASSQSPAPGSSYQHERFNTGFSSSTGTTPASAQSHQRQYYSSTVIPGLNGLMLQHSSGPTTQQEPFVRPSTRRFSHVDFGWQTVFDSNNHRIPVYAETWFKKDWEVVEIHENHCLFKRKLTDKHLVNVLSMKTKKLTMFDLKSEPMAVGLSHDGRFLISSLGISLTIIDVQTHKVSKRANSSGVRQWTSNRHEFCWVDRDGLFWVWSFVGADQPKQVFRLQSTAPSASMRPLTSADGTWYAICATDRDRMSGVVHCYPANNEPAQVFDGVSAGFMQVAGVDGMNVHALATLKNGAEGGQHFFEMQVHYLGQGRGATQPRRYPNETIRKSLPRLWDDPGHSMVVAAVATRSDGYFAYVFDSATGDLLCTHPINEEGHDRVHCGAGGLFAENEGRAIKRLQLHPGGLVLDTSPMTMPSVQSPTTTMESEPLSSPSTTALPPQAPPPLKEYGRVDTVGFSESSSTITKRKTSGWKGMFKSMSGSSGRGDRIVSTSQGSRKTQDHAFNNFGQSVGEDEDWLYQRK